MFDRLFDRVNLVCEGMKQTKQKYVDTGKLPEEIFKMFVEGDPTMQKGKYLDWMAKTYVANPERPEHMVDVVRMFHRMAMRKRIDKSDIYQYRTLDELEQAAIAVEKTLSKTAVKKKVKEEGATTVLENDRMKIVVPDTYEASKVYGKGTKWCTAMDTTEHHWKSYYRQGCKLYYIIDKLENKKYAVLVYPNGNKQVYDEQDKSIEFSFLEKKLGLKSKKKSEE